MGLLAYSCVDFKQKQQKQLFLMLGLMSTYVVLR